MVSTEKEEVRKHELQKERRENNQSGGIKKQDFRNVNKGRVRRWREVENMKG